MELTLDSAIDHLSELLSDATHEWRCEECKQEHIQLLTWLCLLRSYQESGARPVPKGQWNKVRDPYLYRLETHDGVCSVCGFAAGYNEATRFFKFCPSCGAKMEAGDDS